MLFGDYIKEEAAIHQRLDDIRRRVAWSKDLDSIYDEIYRHNVAGSDRDRKVADEIYQIVIDCFSPLTTAELLQVLAFRAQDLSVLDPRYVLRVTRNLLVETAASGLIRFCHLSAYEFVSRTQARFASATDLSRRHGSMTDLCLTYLQTPSNYTFGVDNIEPLSFAEVVLEPPHIFVYASVYWMRHCGLAADHIRTNRDLLSHLSQFVCAGSPYYSAWRSATQQSTFRYATEDSIPDTPSLLIMAIICGWEALKPDLIESWTSRDMTLDGKTVLHHAVIMSDSLTIKAMLDRYATEIIDCVDRSNITALAYAISLRNVDIVHLLLEHGASIFNCYQGQTALHTAGANTEMLETFLKYLSTSGQLDLIVNSFAPPLRAPSRDLDRHLRTPLHLLVDYDSRGHEDSIIRAASMLLKYGANVNAIDEHGRLGY